MKLMLAAALLSAATGWTMLPERYAATEESIARTPPPAWAPADSADSLYRAGRRALNRRDFDAAARLFDQIVVRFPRSTYAPDALYWKGFALSRAGRTDDAIAALEAQAERYPRAATRRDAESLLIRLKGELARRGDTSAQRDVARAAQSSTADCTDMEIRIAALDALQQMDDERALPLLRRVLERRDACSVPLRRNALFILARKSGAERERVLLGVARSDPSSEVRQEAVFHLSQARSDAAIDALEELLRRSDDHGVRSNALFALAQHRSDRARGILQGFALDSSAPAKLRSDALFHLAQNADGPGRAWLRDAFAKLEDRKLKDHVLFHLAQRPDAPTRQWLIGLVTDQRTPEELRKNALFHLVNDRQTASAELAALYDRITEREVRKNLIFYLAQRGDDDAVGKLIAIAKTDTDIKLRKDALFHLGQSKNPRALRALEEIVTP